MNTDNKVNKVFQESSDDKCQDTEMYSFDDELYKYFNGDLLAGIYGFGFERPSPIQSKAIIPILNGKDIIGQAQAGSGKTGAYLIPALTKIDPKLKNPQVIVIANSHPLAMQIHYNAKKIGQKLIENHGVKMSLCIGGNGTKESRVTYDELFESHVLVATPGRLVAMSEIEKKNRSKLSNESRLLDKVKLLILDEADILLQDGFVAQIQKIIRKIPKTAQICLFSATYPQSVVTMADQFLVNPMKILVKNEEISVDGIKNYWVNVEREEYKYDNLVDIYKKVSVCQAVIFVNSVTKAKQLSTALQNAGHSVGAIYREPEGKEGNENESTERFKILEEFRKTQIRVLVATDIISRGIDVQKVGLVINYDVPYDTDKYIHRVGRSGRFGKLGVAITFMVKSRQDISKMEEIESKYKINFEELKNASDIEMVNNYLTGIKSSK